MKLPFKIALRFLKSSKGQTILIISGIAIGVSVQVFIGALIQGLQKSLVNKTIGNSSQVTVVSKLDDKTISNYQQKVDTIKSTSSSIKNISVSADSPAFIKFNSKNASVLIRGFNIDDADKIYNIKNRLIEGQLPYDDNSIIIGKELKNELNVSLGDKIEVSTSKGKKAYFVIKGVYDLKVSNINNSWIITNLSTSQKLFDLNDKITSIEMQLNEKDVFSADKTATLISNKLSDNDIKVQDWKTQNQQLLSGLSGQSVSSIMIQTFVLISVVLGIASVLAISVVQKSKQIGILKAMGIKDRAASEIFLFQGFLLGIGGAIMGVALGLLLSFAFTKFALNTDGTPVIELYINYNFIMLSALIALLASTLAALIPARSSSKLQPMEVIKNG